MRSTALPRFTERTRIGEKEVKDKDDFQEIMAEEKSRARRHQKKAVTLARERMIRKVADLLADRNCEKRTFLAVIRGYGYQRGVGRISSTLRVMGRSARQTPRAARSAFLIHLSCSSGGSAERWRETIFVNWFENWRAVVRRRFLGILISAWL